MTVDKTNSIVICAMPRSGSTYLTKYLERGLGYGYRPPVPNGMFPDYSIAEYHTRRLGWGNSVWQVHLDPKEETVDLLTSVVDRMVLHVRDPRQALLSWVHFSDQFKVLNYNPPDGFYDKPFDYRLEWSIGNHFPALCSWVHGWINASTSRDLTILITEYEYLLKNIRGLANRILEFNDVNCAHFVETEISKRESRFRRGLVSEWRQVFTSTQRQECWSLMCEWDLNKLYWSQ